MKIHKIIPRFVGSEAKLQKIGKHGETVLLFQYVVFHILEIGFANHDTTRKCDILCFDGVRLFSFNVQEGKT